MGRVSCKLRIGEKIGLSFGFVGLLFLGVIWQYQVTLNRSLADYQHLHDVFEASKGLALGIDNSMLSARRAEKDFLLQRDERFVQEVARAVARVRAQAEELRKTDPAAAQTADEIALRTDSYYGSFQELVEAWRKKGLDHDSGLQGAFRETAHRLEDMAAQFEVGQLFRQLLQMRRAEKDLGLRRQAQYRDRALAWAERMREQTVAGNLPAPVKARLLEAIETYRQTFQVYAARILALEDTRGGKGPFRDAAHRIEALLDTHFVPALEVSILQLRRREKDYLLRGDEQYIAMAQQELQHIGQQVQSSAIAAPQKDAFRGLLADYERDFLALVEQNQRIVWLSRSMRVAADRIASLVRQNVANSNWLMAEQAAIIRHTSDANARFMLWVVLGASLLGIFFAIVITRRITQPLRRMAGLLDQLAYDEPGERMPTFPGGRDEVNTMAESVNTLADNKARFMAWWRASLREVNAGEAPAVSDSERPGSDRARAAEGSHELAMSLYRDMQNNARQSLELARRIAKAHAVGKTRGYADAIDKAAKATLAALAVLMEDRNSLGDKLPLAVQG